MAKPTPTYTPVPEVPPAVRARYTVMLQVLGGTLTVSEGARRLGLSRMHFQTLLHRGLTGFVAALQPKAPGRPRRPATQTALARENARLTRQTQRLQRRVETTDRLLKLASGLLKGRRLPSGRSRRARATRPAREGRDEPAEPDGEWRPRLAAVRELRELGLSPRLAAAVVGVSAATLTRWARWERQGRPPCRRRGPASANLVVTARAATLVRELHGLVGAEALARSVVGLSRRQAAAIKHATLIELEQERRRRATRLTVTAPGILRGLDGLYVSTRHGTRHLLIAADGCVPYRTSVLLVVHYTGEAVAELLAADFARHGPPLVCRLDRARAHATAAVAAVLRAYQVLVLQGPTHYPQFYGQLERQNREHRAWLDADTGLEAEGHAERGTEMVRVLNTRWRRRSLAWQTAEERWRQRPGLSEDRAALREEVCERAARIRSHLNISEARTDLAERLAIERALEHRGYLRRELGGWC